MKRLSKISVVLLISLLCILGLSTTAFAEETQSSDGLQASIATNSDEYKTNDDIKVELKVKNTNDFDINSVSMNTVVPNGLTVKDNASTSKTVGTLKSGKEESYSIILNVQSTSSGTGTTSTSPQTGNTASTSATTNGESSVGTGDVRNIAVLVIVLVISAVLMIYNRKKLSKHISIMLCFAICLTSIAAVGISSANAAEQNSFTVSKTIKVDDKSYTIGLKISYDKNSITDAVNLTGYKMSEASAYIDNDLYADVEDLSHVAVDSDTLISYFDNEVSFMVKDGVTERDVVDNVINKYDAIIVGKSSATGRYLIRFNNNTYTYDEILKIQDELSKNQLVEAAYANYAIELDEDAYEPQEDLWSGTYDNIPNGDNWGVEAINAPEAWDYYDLMDDVEVGVFESKGFYSDHPDLRNRIRRVENTQGTLGDHGTHVTGIIAAEFNNQIGINGVSPTARISYIDEVTAGNDNFSDEHTSTSSFAYSNAFDFLIHKCNCKVINASNSEPIGWTYCASGNGSQQSIENARYSIETHSKELEDTLLRLLDTKDDKGNNYDFTICVTAGNDRNRYLYKIDEETCNYEEKSGYFPGAINTKESIDAKYNSGLTYIENLRLKERIIVVGNAQNGKSGEFFLQENSNKGDRVDVLAPGTKIQSTVTSNPDKSHLEKVKRFDENGEKNYYALDTGTSMASPHVAGIAAILYSLNPNLTGKEVKDIICESATTNVNGTDKKMVDAEAAVKLLLSKGDYYTSPCKYSYERAVVDQNNNPIPDVKVTVTSYFKSGAELNHQDITTNSNGILKFSEYAGEGKITLEKEGYETVTIEEYFDKGATYDNMELVTMKKIVDDKQYTASELVNRDLYDILAELGDDYTLDNYGRLKYEKYGFTLVTDFNRNISTPNEFSDPLPESEKQRFNEALKNKTLTLQYINVFGDGKLDDNINAGMFYNDLISYYGSFDCDVVNLVEFPYTGHSMAYSYNVIDDRDSTLVTYLFNIDENSQTNNDVAKSDSLKEINPKLYYIRVNPGFNDESNHVDWTTGHGYRYYSENKGTGITIRHQYGGKTYLELWAADGALMSCFILDWDGNNMECSASDTKGNGNANIKITVNDARSKINLEIDPVDGNISKILPMLFDVTAQSKLSCVLDRDDVPYINFHL